MHGIDEGGLETGPSATAPVLYSTVLHMNLLSSFVRQTGKKEYKKFHYAVHICKDMQREER
jgi:hypothetical protein